MILCSYGCEKPALYQFKNGKWCCSDNISKCKKVKEKLVTIGLLRMKGKNNPMFGKTHSDETKKKIGIKSKQKNYSLEYREKLRISSTGRKQPPEQREKSRQRCLNGLSSYMHSFVKPESIEKQRYRMLNGGAIKALRGMKNPSDQELKLRDIVKELYSNCEFQHPVFNYSLDIAIVDKKIAIEYDGYYHFDTEEHKEYHKLRQEKIEKEGWKFLRYTMFDKFPNKDQVNEDIKIILERKK